MAREQPKRLDVEEELVRGPVRMNTGYDLLKLDSSGGAVCRGRGTWVVTRRLIAVDSDYIPLGRLTSPTTMRRLKILKPKN
jgi:hypothetical protein